MTGVKISALPPSPSSQLNDLIAAVQLGVTQQQTLQQVMALAGTALTGTFLPLAGGTMSGIINMGGNIITNLPLPTVGGDAVNKTYADTVIGGGFTVILAVQAATTANLNATPAGAGVGATLTNAGAMAAFSVDGISPAINSRILVKNQTLTQNNGVYNLTTVGSGAVNWVLTRSTDYDTAAQIKPGTLIAVNNGTVNGTTSWLETATVVTVDTDPIVFSQFTFQPGAFFLIANNLSEGVPATMLVNLGLGVPTGTGNVVLQTSPTLISPILGNATATSLTFSSTAGIIGTTTNNSANVGSVGEFVSSVILNASAVPIVNNVAKNITSIALTSGDWDVWGNVTYDITGSVPVLASWSSTTSASQPDPALVAGLSGSFGNGSGMTIPRLRYSLSVPTTVFLSTTCLFSGGATVNAAGGIYARRIR